MQLMLFGYNVNILLVVLEWFVFFLHKVSVLGTATPGSQDGPPEFGLESMVLKRSPTDKDDLAIYS